MMHLAGFFPWIQLVVRSVVIFPTLGDHIRRRRKTAGLTQEDLAAKIGVDRTTVGRWERGEAEPSPPHVALLVRLRIIDRQFLDDLGAIGLRGKRYEYIVPIIAPRKLIIAGCKFGLLHIRSGTGEHNRPVNWSIDFVQIGDRGEMRATVTTNSNGGFEFKCFVDFQTLAYSDVQAALLKAGFVEVSIGEGKFSRAWFLLPDYRVVAERKTGIRNNLYFPE